MEKSIILLTAFLVILLAAAPENSSAQGSQSLFQGFTLSDDSLSTLSSRTEKIYIYVDPGAADPGKVAGEFLAGWIGAAAFGYVGGRVGWNLTYVEHKHESKGFGNFDLNLSGLPGAIAGYLILSNLGCAAGVSLVGNTGGEKGSYWTSFGGSIAGSVIGGLCALGIASATEYESWAPAIVLTAAQAGGATLGFNRSRKKVVEKPSEALLNLNNNELSLAFPQMNVSQDLSGCTYYRVNLLQADF